MRLSGSYLLHFPGQPPVMAPNDVTDAGLAWAAAKLAGNQPAPVILIGLRSLGPQTPSDTLNAHPGWTPLSPAEPTSLSAVGMGLQTPVMALGVATDGVAGGIYLVVDGELFSGADFEPQTVVAGDTVTVQYRLELSR